MKRILVLAIVLTFAFAAFAADVSGTWQGTFKTREGGAFETVLTVKQAGEKLTGSWQQGNRDPRDIENGKVAGDTVTFTLSYQSDAGARHINYTGKVAGKEMKVTISAEGNPRTQEMTLTKQ